MQKYFVITFGCQMNRSDSERIAVVLEDMGYKKASKMNGADLIVINMCSVRQSAVDRVYGLVPKFQKLKAKNPKVKTLLSGCVLKRNLRKLQENFDYILSIKALSYWKDFLNKEKFFYYPDLRKPEIYERFDSDYLKIRPNYSSSFSAFVPIMTGCNNFCSFCVVPYVRGLEISRPTKEILGEVKSLTERSYKEIWLLGQNVNSYISEQRTVNSEQRINFPKLLRLVDDIQGNFWIRFTSPHPKDFSDELIKTIAKCEKVTEYVNLPIQSGDDEILKKMNRSYTVGYYKELVRKIREKIPAVCLSTDIIVGFPGETKKQFENTVKLFKEVKFDMAYIAEYSPRPGTAASELKDNVSRKEKEERRKVLTQTLKETALENNRKYIDRTVDVLIMKHETRNMKHFCVGKTRSYKTIKFQVSGSKFQDLIGQFARVKILDANPFGLKGKLI